MRIVLNGMGGVMPRVTPDLLPDSAAQVALNVQLIKGGVASLKAPVTVATPSKVGAGKTIYRYGRTPPVGQEEALYWLKWDKTVNVCKGPIANDTQERAYYTGDGLPKKTDMVLALQSGTDYPMAWRYLGVPKPTAAPTLSLVAGSGPTVAETRAYVYTNVTEWGEESAPSGATIVTVGPTEAVSLSGFSAVPGAGYEITERYIYRTVTSSSGTNYYYVGAITAAVTEWTDTTDVASISEPLPSLDWDVPPDDLEGIISLPSGALCGISKGLKAVCFSVIGAPYAWPEKFRQTLDYVPVGVAAMGQGVAVLSEGYPYFINSGDPEAATMVRLDEEQACVSARSIVPFAGGALYASPDGLVAVMQSGVKVATAELFDREAWQALGPKGIFAVKHDNRYYGFLPSGGFIFDAELGLTFHDVTATAAFVDPVLDQLYVMVGSAVQRWDSGAAKTHAWKSKRVVAPALVGFSVAQVRANSYVNLMLKVYIDGTLAYSRAVTSEEPFRLPSWRRARRYEVEMTGTDHWTMAVLASSVEELLDV